MTAYLNQLSQQTRTVSRQQFPENKADKFWSNQDILFDYKVDLTGIGNRSPSYMDD